jgi:hypothetical protein
MKVKISEDEIKEVVANITGVDTSIRKVDWYDVIPLLYKYEEATIDPYLEGYKEGYVQGKYDQRMDHLNEEG